MSARSIRQHDGHPALGKSPRRNTEALAISGRGDRIPNRNAQSHACWHLLTFTNNESGISAYHHPERARRQTSPPYAIHSSWCSLRFDETSKRPSIILCMWRGPRVTKHVFFSTACVCCMTLSILAGSFCRHLTGDVILTKCELGSRRLDRSSTNRYMLQVLKCVCMWPILICWNGHVVIHMRCFMHFGLGAMVSRPLCMVLYRR